MGAFGLAARPHETDNRRCNYCSQEACSAFDKRILILIPNRASYERYNLRTNGCTNHRDVLCVRRQR